MQSKRGLSAAREAWSRQAGGLLAFVLLFALPWCELGCSTSELDAPPISTDAAPTGPNDLPNFHNQGRTTVNNFADSCAVRTIRPERVPLDLIFMFDTSGSMGDFTAGGGTKWEAVRSAFASFARSADSLGVGAAVHFFPLAQPGVPTECTLASQCGAFGPCSFLKTCSNAATNTLPTCRNDADCPGLTGPCLPVGRCGVSNGYCAPLGGRCSSKVGDTCDAMPGHCDGRDVCDTAVYATSAVPVTALPAGAATLVNLLESKVPEGTTPTGPALQGAIARARVQSMQSAGKRVAVVLVTDGFPTSCDPNSIEGIAQVATGGSQGSPPIQTYTVGVFAPGEEAAANVNLAKVSMAGGTPKTFVISTEGNLAADFLAALNDIRATALACEYRIPLSKTGAVDYGKVNLSFLTGASAYLTIGNVVSAAACSPTKGGWYYDVDPAVDVPKTVFACPKTCARFRSDPRGRVDLVVGCKTVPVD